MLTNRPDSFQLSGNYHPCLSDHDLVYGVLRHKINHNKPKVITFRSYKKFDPEHYKQLLSSAPWHVGQLFDDVDDQAYAWNVLMNDILDEVAPVKKMREKDVPYMTSHWKSAIRVFKDNNSSYEQLLEKAHLPTLLNRHLQDLCILMYKVKHKLSPAYISNIFKEPNSNYNLRQADFSIPRYETVTYGKHSIRYLGPRLWTKLPKSIRDVKTLMSFKGKIRQLNRPFRNSSGTWGEFQILTNR